MKLTFHLDDEPEVEISMRRDTTSDEGTTAKALGRLYGGVQEAMQKAGTWQDTMRLSVVVPCPQGRRAGDGAVDGRDRIARGPPRHRHVAEGGCHGGFP